MRHTTLYLKKKMKATENELRHRLRIETNVVDMVLGIKKTFDVNLFQQCQLPICR